MSSLLWLLVLFICQVITIQCKSQKQQSWLKDVSDTTTKSFHKRNDNNRISYGIPAGSVSYSGSSYNKEFNKRTEKSKEFPQIQNRDKEVFYQNSKNDKFPTINVNGNYFQSNTKSVYEQTKINLKNSKSNKINGNYGFDKISDNNKGLKQLSDRYTYNSDGYIQSSSNDCNNNFADRNAKVIDDEQDLETSDSFKFFVKVPVPVEVPKPYPVHVPRPYPVTVVKPVPFPIVRGIPVPVEMPVSRGFPLLPNNQLNLFGKSKSPFNIPMPISLPPLFSHGENLMQKIQQQFGAFDDMKPEEE